MQSNDYKKLVFFLEYPGDIWYNALLVENNMTN